MHSTRIVAFGYFENIVLVQQLPNNFRFCEVWVENIVLVILVIVNLICSCTFFFNMFNDDTFELNLFAYGLNRMKIRTERRNRL